MNKCFVYLPGSSSWVQFEFFFLCNKKNYSYRDYILKTVFLHLIRATKNKKEKNKRTNENCANKFKFYSHSFIHSFSVKLYRRIRMLIWNYNDNKRGVIYHIYHICLLFSRNGCTQPEWKKDFLEFSNIDRLFFRRCCCCCCCSLIVL